MKVLKLVPEGIPETARGADIIKRLLSNLGTIGNGLAELRGLYGTGHGKHGAAVGLRARHARLAVGSAAILATFLFETHQDTNPIGHILVFRDPVDQRTAKEAGPRRPKPRQFDADLPPFCRC